MKKILIIDDSALMRTVLSDIINSDSRFRVVDKAKDGVEGLDLLKKNTYDAVVLECRITREDNLVRYNATLKSKATISADDVNKRLSENATIREVAVISI